MAHSSFEILAVIVNYNLRPFIGTFKKLIEGLAEFSKYASTKTLLVDNSSTDGSFEEAVEHARKLGLDLEAIKLSRNFGFTRAANIAWHHARRRWSFKYLMLLNNDLVIVPWNLAKLLPYLEIDGVAGVQGTIMQMANPALIDNSGHMIDQHGLTLPVCRGYTIECARLYTPSYLSGACSIYRADVIAELGQPFDNRVESYYDDKHLGLRLWSRGYKLLHVPIIAAYHLGSASYSGLNKLIKGPKWFEGIVVAELAPKANNIPSTVFVAVNYVITAALFSAITRDNYIEYYVQALRKLAILRHGNENTLQDTPYSKTYFFGIKRLFKGIKYGKKE
ncbi:MAG: glycosyltransferase [Infirmifilum sp.]